MKAWLESEDGWAVLLGVALVGLGVLALAGADVSGWVVQTQVWIDLSKATAPASVAYAGLPGIVSLLLTYLFLLVLLLAVAYFLKLDLPRFALGFTALFAISYLCWLLGHNAYLAATPEKRASFGVNWSLGLTGEAGFIVALLAGLLIGNFLPGVAHWLKEAARPELYIKTAIVILGAALAVKTAARRRTAHLAYYRPCCSAVWPPSSKPT